MSCRCFKNNVQKLLAGITYFEHLFNAFESPYNTKYAERYYLWKCTLLFQLLVRMCTIPKWKYKNFVMKN